MDTPDLLRSSQRSPSTNSKRAFLLNFLVPFPRTVPPLSLFLDFSGLGQNEWSKLELGKAHCLTSNRPTSTFDHVSTSKQNDPIVVEQDFG